MQKTSRVAILLFSLLSLLVLPLAYADSVDTTTSTVTSVKEEIVSQPVAGTAKEEVVSETITTKEEVVSTPVSTPIQAPKPEPVSVAQVAPAAEKDSGKKLKVEVGGGAFFLHRKKYRLIQFQNERERVATQTVHDPYEYSAEGLGAFGNIALEHPIQGDFSMNVSFQGQDLESHESRPVPAGTTSGPGTLIDHASVIPLLTELGKETGLGSAVEIGGKPNDPDSTADTNFKYNTQEYDFAMDFYRNKLYTCEKMKLEVDGLIGWGYMRVNQNFDLHTKGTNVNNQGITETNTSEALRENLFGGRFGMRSRMSDFIIPKLSLFSKFIVGFYGNATNYDGVQEFNNASFVGFNGDNDFQLKVNEGMQRFVPRLQSQTGFAYKITPDFCAAVSYRCDFLMNMSNIDHPEAVFNNVDRDVINHPVRIGSENVTQHYIEVKLGLKF